jgi:predicted MFS family arabinose efflux permease
VIRAVAGAYRGAFSGLNRQVWLLAFVSLINRSGTMVLPFLTLFLIEQRGFTTAEAGRAMAVYGFGAVAGSYLGGWLSDRIEARSIMIGSLAGTALGFFVLGEVEARSAILFTMLGLSVVGEMFRPSNAAAVAAAADPGRATQSFSLLRLAVNVGMTLGPAVGGFLALYNYHWLFWIDGLTCLAAAGVLALYFRPPRPVISAHEEGAAAGAGRSPWSDPFLLALLTLMFVLAVVIFQLMSTYPLTLRQLYGFTEDRIGMILAINTLFVVLFEMVIVHSTRNLDPLRLGGWGCLVFCLGFGLLPFGAGSPFPFAYVAATVAVWSLGEMLSMPMAAGLIANRADEKSRGRYMGLYMLSFSLAFVAAPLIGTWVFDRFGPRAVWYACGLTGIPLWLGFHALSRIERRSREPKEAPDVSSAAAAG